MPITIIVFNIAVKVMAQRPDSTVAIAFVKILDLPFRQIDRVQILPGQFGFNLLALLFPIDMCSAPADPMQWRSCLERCKTGRQPAAASARGYVPILFLDGDRQPVGNNDYFHFRIPTKIHIHSMITIRSPSRPFSLHISIQPPSFPGQNRCNAVPNRITVAKTITYNAKDPR